MMKYVDLLLTMFLLTLGILVLISTPNQFATSGLWDGVYFLAVGFACSHLGQRQFREWCEQHRSKKNEP